MRLYVYMRPSTTPIVIETNLAWAYPYWEAHKLLNPLLHWKLQ